MKTGDCATFLMATLMAFSVGASELESITGDNVNLLCTGVQTWGSFYRGKEAFQPLIGFRVEKTNSSALWRVKVQLADDVDPSWITDVKLYRTSTRYFAEPTDLYSGLAKSIPANTGSREIVFDYWQSGSGSSTLPTIAAGDYFWVGVKVAGSAPADARLDGWLTAVHINGQVSYIDNPSPAGSGTVYPFETHIVPYWRFNTWTMNALTTNHRGLFTDIVAFEVGVNANGGVYGGWHDGKNLSMAEVKTRIATMRERAGANTRILLGVGHCSGQLSSVTQDSDKRVALVTSLTNWVAQVTADGIDFDWEYPNSAADWTGFNNLVADLRPALFALGGGKTVSLAMTGYRITQAQNQFNNRAAIRDLYQQCDFVTTMSYDYSSSSYDNHAPQWLMGNDVQKCIDLGLPKWRVCGGQAYYSNYSPITDWVQYGFSTIATKYPWNLQSVDGFWDNSGRYLTWNSLNTIKSKTRWCRDNGYGIMIWANETDFQPTDARSATRAAYSQIGPKRLGEDFTIESAADWSQASVYGGTVSLGADITIEAATIRPNYVRATVDGQGHTITLADRSALWTSLEGALTNVKFAFADPNTLTWTNPVTGEAVTFNYVFTGLLGTNWNVPGNWMKVEDGKLVPSQQAVLPGLSGSELWDPFVIDGNALIDAANKDVSVSEATVDGWNLRLGAFNGARVTIPTLGKFQGGSEKFVMVDETSKVTVSSWASSGNMGGTTTFSVAAAEGLVFSAGTKAASSGDDYDFNYNLGAAGSVVYGGAVVSGRHHLRRLDLAFTNGSGTKIVRRRALVTFASSTKTFDLSDVAVSNTVLLALSRAAQDSIPSASDPIGTYTLVQEATGLYVYYVDSLNVTYSPTRVNSLTGETNTYSYVFAGSESDDWANTLNWYAFADGGLARYDGTLAPQISQSGKWEPLLFDGDQIEDAAHRNVTVSAGSVEGWNLRAGLFHGMNVTIPTLNKLQYGDGFSSWIVVDETSKFTVGNWGDANSYLYGASFYIDAPEGLTFNCGTKRNPNDGNYIFDYYLGESGSVKYAGGVTNGTHRVREVKLPASSGETGPIVTRSRRIVSYPNATQDFAIACDRTIVQKDDGLYLSYTDNLPARVLAASSVRAHPVTGEDVTYSHVFLGTTDSDWCKVENWYTYSPNGYEGYAAEKGPQLNGGTVWSAILFDGALLGDKTVSAQSVAVEGYNPKIGLCGGVSVLAETLNKLQCADGGTAWINVDDSSRLTIASWGNGNMGGTTLFNINAPDGVSFDCGTKSGDFTFSYAFGANGSVKYAGSVAHGTHRLASVKVVLSPDTHGGLKVRRARTLVSYSSASVSFVTDSVDVEGVTDYTLEQTPNGLVLSYEDFGVPEVLLPDAPIVVSSRELADAAVLRLVVPDEVRHELGDKAPSEEIYRSYFEKKVVDNGDGTYSVSAELKPSVKDTVAAEIVASFGVEEPTVRVPKGLSFGLTGDVSLPDLGSASTFRASDGEPFAPPQPEDPATPSWFIRIELKP